MAKDLVQNRIVIKIGTSTLTHPGGEINLRSFDRIARVVSDLHSMGHEVILVSSGAIAVGASKLRMKERPSLLRLKQAAAAVGQCELMYLYDKSFGEYHKIVGQILLTGEDVEHSEIRQNLINTFDSLLELGIVPIVNENDSVGFFEIEASISNHSVFGDNDTLSAVVAVLCRAQKLILMSDIEGLYSSDPRTDPKARLIRVIERVDDSLLSLAGDAGTSRGTGGMITKLQAAKIACSNGIDMIIINGAKPESLYDIVEGKQAGTLFVGQKQEGCTSGPGKE